MTRIAAAAPCKRCRRNPECRNCGPCNSSLAAASKQATRFRANGAGPLPTRSRELSPAREGHWRRRWAIAPRTQNSQRPQPYTGQGEELTAMLLLIAERDRQNPEGVLWKS